MPAPPGGKGLSSRPRGPGADAWRGAAAQVRRNQEEVGRRFVVLVEGPSKKNEAELCGKTDHGKMAVFPAVPVPAAYSAAGFAAGARQSALAVPQEGDYVVVQARQRSAVQALPLF